MCVCVCQVCVCVCVCTLVGVFLLLRDVPGACFPGKAISDKPVLSGTSRLYTGLLNCM